MNQSVSPRWNAARRGLLMAGVLSLAAMVTACGGGDDSAAATGSGSGSSGQRAASGAEPTREETLVVTFFGPGATQIEDPDNLNPYSLGGLGRVRGILNKTIFEFMYLYNHNTGEQIPWLAESYTVADDFRSVDVTLREGITWHDGEPFTSADVEYTIELLRDNQDLVFSSDMQEWVQDVAVLDDRNFRIILNKPNPRFFFFYFVENSEIHLPILPQHIWESVNPLDYKNADGIGTGPYVVSSLSNQAQVFDRNEDWWAAQVGFQDLPAPRRVSYIPPGAADTAAARMINNEFDVGAIMQPGVFNSARRRNPNIVSWDNEDISHGAADACLYTLGLNTKWGPMADVNVRRAVQAAIDREEMVELAYEGSTVTRVVPYSTYGGLQAYADAQAELIAKYDPAAHSQEMVDEHMAAAGYAKDSEGFWAKGGERISTDLDVAAWLRPMGPVIEKQLQDAGFDISFVLHDPSSGAFDKIRVGNSDAWILVHCGSSSEPHGTLQHYHSKFNSPERGEINSYVWGNSQYDNPEYDAIIDKMDGVLPSPNDPQYMTLANQALEIFLRDVIEITLAEERHVVTFNKTYWTGWADVNDPYVAPYSLWAGFLLEFLNLESAQ